MNFKKYICLLVLTAVMQAAWAQSGVITEDIIKVEGITSPSSINSTNSQTSRTFLDGFGRPIQVVAKAASPLGNDIIQPITYNSLGQQTKSYLPYTGSDGSGNYRADALTTGQGQAAFYSNGSTDKVADDTAPFSQRVFENSPLQRVLQDGAVGSGFQPIVGGHYKILKYRFNTSNDVAQADENGNMVGYYSANTLSATEVMNEAETEKAILYTDNAGRTILKRQLANQTINGVTVTYFDTYYLYNNAGAVNYIIPPKASQLLKTNPSYTIATTAVSNLIYKYVYDSKGRLIEKKVPGAAVLYIVYDPLNRPVLMQDGNLRSANQWNYIKYDVQNRPISQGIHTNATYTTRAAMQTYVDGLASSYNTAWYESRTTSATYAYYTNTIFPTASISPLAFSYFDDYDLNFNGTADYSYQSQGITGEGIATGLTRDALTMLVKRSVGPGLSNIFLTNAFFYDKRGNLIQTQSNNQLYYTASVVTDYKTTTYDFIGKPQRNKVVQTTSASVTNTVLTRFVYNSADTYLSYIDQTYNAQTTKRLVGYTYNELGQLVTKKLGNTTGTNYLQTVDYLYNIRGQLLTINDSKLSASADLFGMQLLYDQQDSNVGNTALFTGNISAVKWMTKDGSGTKTNERSYKYNYDILNRVTDALYAERTSSSSGSFNINSGGFDEKDIKYDEAGNILNLKRYSSTINGAGGTIGDNLTYTYDSNDLNKLLTVTDGGTTPQYTGFGFRNITASASSYSYDNNGNLATDPYKSSSITYNILNKTEKIQMTAVTGRYVDYTYDAGGNVLRKRVYESSALVSTTDYIGGMVYTNSTLDYFGMPEGRVVNNAGTLNPEYVITDHQGNARVSFKDNGSGAVQLLQENSYFAFGKVMPGGPVTMPGNPNRNLYNGGSEWQSYYDNLPDYYQTFYRNYDPNLGRFIGVDPMAEAADDLTIYNYSGNNPVMFNDPIGDLKNGIGRQPERARPPLGAASTPETWAAWAAWDYYNGNINYEEYAAALTFYIDDQRMDAVVAKNQGIRNITYWTNLLKKNGFYDFGQSKGNIKDQFSMADDASWRNELTEVKVTDRPKRKINTPLNLGFGYSLNFGLAVSDWGGNVSLGFFGAPHTVGQGFVTFGRANGLEAGVSLQALAGNTKQKQWDISGSGQSGGFGYGDFAGSYSTVSNGAYNIIGFGPAASIKPSFPVSGAVSGTTTYTWPMLFPTLYNATGFKF